MKRYLRATTRRAGLLLVSGLLAWTAATAQQAPGQGTRMFRLAERKVSGKTLQSLQLLTLARTQTLNLDLAAFRAAAAPQMRIAAMPIAPGVAVDLELYEHNNIAPGADRSYTDANGRRIPLPAPTVRTFRGKVANDPASDVFLAIGDRMVLGHVNMDGKGYEVTTDLGTPKQGDILPVVTYPFSDLPGNMVRCGVNDQNLLRLDQGHTRNLPKNSGGPRLQGSGAINYSIKAGFDADYEYLRLFNGDVALAQDYMVGLASKASAVYERDLETQIVVNYIHIWDNQGQQPYKESVSMDQALYEATGYWKDSSKPERAFMSILSGKPWVNPIGIAWLDVLCIDRQSCNFSAITYTNPSRDIMVLCHEIGHNFSMRHTHDCSWGGQYGGAIDKCAPAEGGSCFTGTQQQLGTIMSYCSQSDLRFDQIQIDWMIPKINENKFGPNGEGCFEFSRKLTVIPQRIIFPIVKLNNPKDTTINAMFRNNSKEDVMVTKIDMTGDVAAFEFKTPLEGFTLKPGETKSLELTFTAKVEEVPQYAKMLVTHNGLNYISQGPVVISFEAYAENKRPVLGFVTKGSGKIDFGRRTIQKPVYDTLRPLYRNQGSNGAPLYVDRTEIVGPDRFDFEMVAGTAPFDLKSGSGRDAIVKFTPSSVGQKTAWLKVWSNSNNIQDGTDSIMLTGEGVVGSGAGVVDLRLRSGAINFGDVKTFKTYDTVLSNFYYNAGTVPLSISFYVDGDNSTDFFSNNSLVEVTPGQGDELQLTFYSERKGAKSAMLIVSTDDVSDDKNPVRVRVDTLYLYANADGLSAVPGQPAEAQGMALTPNPTAGAVELAIAPMNGELGQAYTITITDVVGREVYHVEGRFESDKTLNRIETGNWSSGVYYVKLSSKQGTRTMPLTVKR